MSGAQFGAETGALRIGYYDALLSTGRRKQEWHASARLAVPAQVG
jgi:hypothetical protein